MANKATYKYIQKYLEENVGAEILIVTERIIRIKEPKYEDILHTRVELEGKYIFEIKNYTTFDALMQAVDARFRELKGE